MFTLAFNFGLWGRVSQDLRLMASALYWIIGYTRFHFVFEETSHWEFYSFSDVKTTNRIWLLLYALTKSDYNLFAMCSPNMNMY